MIKILPKRLFDEKMKELNLSDKNISEQKDMYIISISGKFDSHYFKKEHRNVLNLKFHDITDRDGILPFNENHAKRTIDFLKTITGEYILYIHCWKGVSRSGAIGVFAASFLNENVKELRMNHPDVQPNDLVLQILNEY